MKVSESNFKGGLHDLLQGVSRHQLWIFLAWRDVANRYQRSLIGPLWLTITTSIFLVAVGFVYSRIFGADITAYFPYLSVSLMTWVVLTTLLNEMAIAFVGGAHYVLNLNSPKSIYLYRTLVRNLIMAAHLLPIWIAVVLIFHVPISWTMLLAIPGSAISVGIVFCVGTGVAILSSRFRDVPMILMAIIQVMFFVTPVMWQPSLIPLSAKWVVELNPLVPLLDLVRGPLLGVAPTATTWALGCAFLAISAGVAILAFGKFGRRLTYWL